MSSARVRIGIPLRGLVLSMRDEIPAPPDADDWLAKELDGFWIERNRTLRPLPKTVQYAPTANANPVTLLRNVLFGDNTSQILRHTHNSIHRLSGGAWISLIGALDLNAVAAQRWGAALVPGNTGRGYHLFSTNYRNGTPTDQIFFWDGAAASISNTWASGTPSPARHVVSFADRAILFDQLVGGTAQRRRAQWSIRGNGISWNGTGSGSREFGEFENAITGAAPLGRVLYVFSERSIIEGAESYDVDDPVYYRLLTGTQTGSGGIGLWAPNSLISAEDHLYFLSQSGFRSLGPDGIVPIGAPIDDHIISNIQRSAINTVCAIHIPPPLDLLMWALPMSTTGLPSEFWFYDRRYPRWFRSTTLYSLFQAVTSLGLVTQTTGVTWDSFAPGVTWNSHAAGITWDSFGGTATTPTIIAGHNNGVVTSQDPNSLPSSSLTVRLRTPSWTFENLIPPDKYGRSSFSDRITPGDVLTIDGIELTYRSLSTTASSILTVRASFDNGATFSSVGNLTLSSGVIGKLRTAYLGTRLAGRRILIDIASSSGPVPSALSHGIEDLAVYVQRSGESRFAE